MFEDFAPTVPIAVVGLGALLPGSENTAGFWRTVSAGRDMITEVPADRWLLEDFYDPDPLAPDKTYAKRGAFLSATEFDPLAFGVLPKNLDQTDAAQLLSLMVAERVLAEVAGGDPASLDRDRTGIVLGASTLNLVGSLAQRMSGPALARVLRAQGLPDSTVREAVARFTGLAPEWGEASFPGLLTNVLSGRIANRFDLHGMNHTTDAACASSFAALHTAVDELASGRADLMLAGGVDTASEAFMFVCFSKTPALSLTGDCRPFSEQADGTMLGEGIAMFALKRLADVERDGDKVYAVIRGIGTASDGGGTAIYAPVPEGQARALRRAYERAGYSPSTVELVEAHGTGTKAGDAAEFAGLRSVFGDDRDDAQWCALGSVKSQIGHTKCTAGAAGLLKAILALHHRVLPPTIKVDAPNPSLEIESSPFYLNTAARPWVRGDDHPRRASVSSFGFGGSNFHVTVEEYVPSESGWAERAPRSRTAATELWLFSADTKEGLAERELSAQESQRRFEPKAPFRLAVVATDEADLKAKITQARELIGREAAFTAPGLAYASGPAELGGLALLFPGQGSQYVGMGADLAMQLPAAQRAWDRYGTKEFDGTPLHRVVFPCPVFTDADRVEQKARITATEWAQPALAAHSLALLDVVRALGLRPDCVAGHSFGELTALHAAGVLDADALLDVARRRGELMRDAAQTTAGAMLAVTANHEKVEAVIAELDGVWIANHNAPEQIVLSGTTAGIAAAEAAFKGVTTRRLEAATAFHSPVVADAAAPFAEHLSTVDISESSIPVYGNTDGDTYPSEVDEVRGRIAGHLAAPVLFQAQIEAMYAAGARTFVEVGAGSTLTGLVGRVLGDRPHVAVCLDRARRNGMTTVHEALGRLAVAGAELDYAVLWEEYGSVPEPQRKDGARMTVKVDGGHYDRSYPPKDGELAPSPVPAQVTNGHLPVPAPPVMNGHVDQSTRSLLEETQRQAALAHADYQRQTAEAHADYQRRVTESHLAYLRMSELSLSALLGTPAPAAPPPTFSPAPVAFQPPPMPAPPSIAPSVMAPPVTSQPVTSPSVMAPPPPVAAPAAVPAPAPIPAEAPAALSEVDIDAKILEVVAERTGYPAEILNLDMELESDLGIDSIKRVEILSAFRDHTGDLPDSDIAEFAAARTLREVAEKVRNLNGAPAPAEPKSVTPVLGELVRSVPAAVPTTRAELAVAGLFDGPIAVIDDGTGIAEAIAVELREHGCAASVETEVPQDATGLILLNLAEVAADKAVAHLTIPILAASAIADRCKLLVTVQDTGGDFGLSGAQGDRAWTAGLSGLARTAAREWPDSAIKALDLERGARTPGELAEAVVRELLEGGPDLDVGLRADGTRNTLRMRPEPLSGNESMMITKESVIVATGGARGVTAASLIELAKRRQPRIVLLGRTTLKVEPAGLRAHVDEPSLVRALAATRQADPAALSAQAKDILAGREVRDTIVALEDAGATVRYTAVDVRDEAALTEALSQVRAEWGPITGIVHGAGVLADKHLVDKTSEQIERVLRTKIDSLRTLLRATADDPVDLLCLFSSVTGLFGNAGQADYAVANEVLDQVAAVELARKPGRVVRSIDWGPWHGGMVTPQLAELFTGNGVPLIPIAAGASAFAEEALRPGAPSRVCLAQQDGTAPASATTPMEIVVNEVRNPYLVDHTINGVTILPVVMAIEWFIRAAGEPVALQNFRVLRKVTLPGYRGDGDRLTVQRSGADLELRDGVAHMRATLGEHTGPRDWPELADTSSPFVPVLYDGVAMFHGPQFQSLRKFCCINDSGAVAEIVGTTELDWPVDEWETDGPALDGMLQLACVWAGELLRSATLPMAIGEIRTHGSGPLGAGRCVVFAGKTGSAHTTCDVVLTDSTGAVRAEFLDVELVRRPS
ncbi:SDR family oxidoreductase [Allokutzneria sp. A3M-2-11 16]|uniref:type I polyketide synthase n=1 Tax=Allokutzneria sp. A3M-2-11 16 TaxID=2962043 RepID=UPI0020B753E1|nr:type I polyketide synthase [Allokutzneria sp. A3M-2-11 16]MCP3804494.1 SDR family oxidoreductase [Allokutzneria sp. A3M-2-11 16]